MQAVFKKTMTWTPLKWIGMQLQRNSYVTEATFQTQPFKLHKLQAGPADCVTVTRDQALDYYTRMSTIRRLEATVIDLFTARVIRCPAHMYSGQEACSVGVVAALSQQDAVITSYRVTGWIYSRGTPVTAILGEMTGRVSGCGKGKGGTMHMYSSNFFGGYAVVGAQVPLGTGIALAKQYSGLDEVCVTVYGDGAANQGQVFEAFNMAKLWDLPVVYVCENNGYGKGTSVERSSASTDFYTRGDYIPGVWVDATDLVSVIAATRFARDLALTSGPVILECDAYRYSGHIVSDTGYGYRTKEEVEEHKKQDPIVLWREKITSAGLVTAEELETIDSTISEDIEAAAVSVQGDPELSAEELYTDVYRHPPPGLRVRGCDPTIMAPTR